MSFFKPVAADEIEPLSFTPMTALALLLAPIRTDPPARRRNNNKSQGRQQ